MTLTKSIHGEASMKQDSSLNGGHFDGKSVVAAGGLS